MTCVMNGVEGTVPAKESLFLKHTATVGEHLIHCRIGGSGPTLLMLHGMTLTGAQWLPFAEHFTDSYRVIVADLPGHGGSSPLEGAFSFKQAAQLLHVLLDELKSSPVYGIGHSAGGITLLNMAVQQPERFEALVLVDGPHRIGSAGRKFVREDTWEALPGESKEWYRHMHPGGQPQAEFIYKQYNGLAESHEDIPVEVLKTLPMRTLLVWGDRDPYFPLELPMEMYHALPHAALWVIPGQEHTPLWVDMGGSVEAARLFTRMTTDFFAGK